MSIAFLAFLLAYILHALVTNYRAPKGQQTRSITPLMFLLQTPLVLLAFYVGLQQGLFNRSLVSPLHLLGGLVLGHLVFSLSLLATHTVPTDVWEHFLDIRRLWRFLVESPGVMLRFIGVSFSEELIYRVAAQALLISWFGKPALMIVMVAIGFALVHKHFFENPFVQSAEFFAFSILLGALYYATGSLLLVLVVHTLRNLESVYLEYLIKLEELGDEAQAASAVEAEYIKHPATKQLSKQKV